MNNTGWQFARIEVNDQGFVTHASTPRGFYPGQDIKDGDSEVDALNALGTYGFDVYDVRDDIRDTDYITTIIRLKRPTSRGAEPL